MMTGRRQAFESASKHVRDAIVHFERADDSLNLAARILDHEGFNVSVISRLADDAIHGSFRLRCMIDRWEVDGEIEKEWR